MKPIRTIPTEPRPRPFPAATEGDAEWTFDVVIIGAGPAGSVAALSLLPQRGETRDRPSSSRTPAEPRVLIVDREEFPRGKVCGCCLNGAAVGVLEKLGLQELPATLGAIPLRHWRAQIAGRCTSVKLPTGWAVSREALDAALLDRVRHSGASVRTGVVARVLCSTVGGVQIELKASSGAAETIWAGAVVVASGLSGGGLDHLLPWRRPPAGPIGFGATLLAPGAPYDAGTIYMACDATGYAGLVRLEDGRLDVAAAVYDPSGDDRRRSAGQRIAEILDSAGMPPLPEIETVRWRGTPRLHRQRLPGCGRVVAVGDAAGYVEPFTGEGMAWAMQTGRLAAEVITRARFAEAPVNETPVNEAPVAGAPVTEASVTEAPVTGPSQSASDVGALYTRAYHQLLARRRLPCRVLTAALRPALTRRMLFRTLSAAPWLAGPVVRLVNRAD